MFKAFFKLGGRRWIRTIEAKRNRFTVCPLWPLGNSPISSFSKIKAYCLNSRLQWSWWTDLNPRPADYKSAALPTELHQPYNVIYYITALQKCQAIFLDFPCFLKTEVRLFKTRWFLRFIFVKRSFPAMQQKKEKIAWFLSKNCSTKKHPADGFDRMFETIWSRRQDSNLRHLAPKASTLPSWVTPRTVKNSHSTLIIA